MTRGSRLALLLCLLPSPCLGQSMCERAVAVKEPCDGVLMPRAWALECAVLKKGKPVAPIERPWYTSPWFAFALGIPVGGAVVWAATR